MPVAHEAALQEAKNTVPRGASDYADRVLVIWFREMGAAIVRTDERQRCPDCRENHKLWTTRSWGEICGWCLLSRMENGGTNTRQADAVERQARGRGGSR